jgi:transcriptional regulator with XRE-family HTH domain
MNRIRKIRVQRGIKLRELAERIGYSTSHLSELETGKKRLNTTHLERIAPVLNVRPSELLETGDDPDVVQLVDAFLLLPSDDRAAVIRHALSLRRQAQK